MKEKILIVDDVEMNRAMLVQILRDDYEIMEAKNGRQALSILEEHHDELAIVLLDLIMPELDGFGVLKEMKERKWIEKLPVLVISGEDAAGTEEQCFEYGAVDYIRKPFNQTLVRLRIRNTVKLFKYRSELENLSVEKITDGTLEEEILEILKSGEGEDKK